ncbi:MAG: type II secretion system F family protein [Geminicoccaceae bacterium]
MPSFAYKALTAAGERVSGEVDAFDRKAAIQRLQADGLIPIDAEPAAARTVSGASAGGTTARASQQVTTFTRELSTLLKAGEPIERALALVIDDSGDRKLSAALGRVLGKVRSGEPFSDALAMEPRHFSRLYVGMVRAGEATGRLHEQLGEIATLQEREAEVRRKLMAAMTYPIILVVVALASIALLLGYVVPQFTPLFANAMDRLPASTRWILSFSTWIEDNGRVAFIGGSVVVLAALLSLQTGLARPFLDRFSLSLPLIGTIARERATAQLARGLSTLLRGGLDLPAAIAMTREMIANSAVQAGLARALGQIRQGRRLADALRDEDFVVPMGLRLFRTGEESGRLAELSGYLADQLEARIVNRTTKLVSLMEPLLVVTLGVAVGGIVISILNAVLTVNELAI